MSKVAFEVAFSEHPRLGSDPSRGYVYYLRLKTHVGICYKLGFTTKKSAEERFSYGCSDDYKLIDKVLLFKYMENAYQVEQDAHKAFALHYRVNNSYPTPNLPLYENGQRELYFEDILGLDEEYLGSPTEEKVKKRAIEQEKQDDLGIKRMLSPDVFKSGYDEISDKSKILGICAGVGLYILSIALAILCSPVLIWEVYESWKDKRDPVAIEESEKYKRLKDLASAKRNGQCEAIRKVLLS